MFKKLVLSLVAAATSVGALAGGDADIALSNKSIRLEHNAVVVGTGAHLSTGVIYNEEKNNWAVALGFNAVDASMANTEVITGIGFKGMVFSTSLADVSGALGLGGFVRWQPDFMNGLGLEAQGYYAPSIISFGELVDGYELVSRVTYKVLPQARVFVGYHRMAGRYELDNGEEDSAAVDSTIHVGFRMTY